jgi:hypothetical protein
MEKRPETHRSQLAALYTPLYFPAGQLPQAGWIEATMLGC